MHRRTLAALLGCAGLAATVACGPTEQRPAVRAAPPPPSATVVRDTVVRDTGARDGAPDRVPRVAMLGVVSGRGAAVSTVTSVPSDRTPPPAATPTLSFPTLRAACDAVSAMLAPRLGEPAARTDDTTLTMWSRRPGSRGCVLGWKGTFARTPGLSAEIVAKAFRAAGWVPVEHISADGPGGSVFGMLSRTALCVAGTDSDPGDPGDSTYVVEDWWRLDVECDDDLAPASPSPQGG